MAVVFCIGAFTFFGADWLIDRRGGADRKDIAGDKAGGSGSAIFIGTLLDNIPKSIILGMSLALGGAINLAFLAAVFISNLPEGVAGSINLEAAGRSRQIHILDVDNVGVDLSRLCRVGLHDNQVAARRKRASCPGFCRRSHADHAGGCDDAGSVRARRQAGGDCNCDGFFGSGDTGCPGLTRFYYKPLIKDMRRNQCASPVI